jgi:hypothetical protein
MLHPHQVGQAGDKGLVGADRRHPQIARRADSSASLRYSMSSSTSVSERSNTKTIGTTTIDRFATAASWITTSVDGSIHFSRPTGSDKSRPGQDRGCRQPRPASACGTARMSENRMAASSP